MAFDLAVLKAEVITIDLSPWWLGGTDDVREAPALWLAVIVSGYTLIAARKWLRRNFAIEQAFVGALLAAERDDPVEQSRDTHGSIEPLRASKKRSPTHGCSSQPI